MSCTLKNLNSIDMCEYYINNEQYKDMCWYYHTVCDGCGDDNFQTCLSNMNKQDTKNNTKEYERHEQRRKKE